MKELEKTRVIPFTPEKGTPGWHEVKERAIGHVDPDEKPQYRPEVSDDALAGLRPAKKKESGVHVKARPGKRLILVSVQSKDLDDDPVNVLSVEWLTDGKRFLIWKRVKLAGGRLDQPVEYQTTSLHEAWDACGEWGVTVNEFQAAFVDLPPEVEWTFELCPDNCTDCDLTYYGDPRSRGLPAFLCRKCGAHFSMANDGSMTYTGKRTVPGAEPPTPPQPLPVPTESAEFVLELMDVKGLGPTGIKILVSNGFISWEALKENGHVGLLAMGLKKKQAMALLKAVKDRTDAGV